MNDREKWRERVRDIRALGSVHGVFANVPGDQGSIPDRVIPKTQKKVLDVALLNTQDYKVRIKNKVKQYREKNIYSKTGYEIK